MQARHQGAGDRDPRADITDAIGVGMIDNIAIQQVAVARGDAGGAGLEAEFAHHLRGRALDGPPAVIASRMPGIARIGSTLMKGLDGQTITARTSPERSAAVMSACGRASITPSKASSWTTGRHCWRTK